jgi:hypothetical protein
VNTLHKGDDDDDDDDYDDDDDDNVILIPIWTTGHLQSFASGLYSGLHFSSLSNSCVILFQPFVASCS